MSTDCLYVNVVRKQLTHNGKVIDKPRFKKKMIQCKMSKFYKNKKYMNSYMYCWLHNLNFPYIFFNDHISICKLFWIKNQLIYNKWICKSIDIR